MSKEKSLEQRRQDWEKSTLAPALNQSPEDLLVPETPGVTVKERIYFPNPEFSAENYVKQQGFPGEFPFTRGNHPLGYRSKHWTMRQYAGFGSARESNARYHYLLEQGQTGLSVAFDLPTQMGFDSDHAMAKGEVGRVGVAISSLDDMKMLLKGLPLGKISTSMTINSTAPILLSFYLACAQEAGVGFSSLRGTVQNDLLKEYIARGTYIYPPEASLRLIVDLMEFCSKSVPKWNTISISGYHIREAGSTATQEIAFTLANGIAYVEAAQRRGLDINDLGQRLSFFFNVHNDFLEEVAKFRAARRMWARIMRDRFGVKDSRAQMLRFHAQTAGSSLTAQQPYNNVVRVTLQALAAVLGGTQSLHTNSLDEALGLPTQEAATLALRTQQILAHESGVTQVVDPLGGSYYIESLTDSIEQGATALIEKIDGMGGMVRAIEKGFPQKEIQTSAYLYQKQVEEKSRTIVGVNQFQEEVEKPYDILKLDEAIEKEQVSRLAHFKKHRAQNAVKESLENLRRCAEGKDNTVAFVLAAVKAGATLGEISDELRSVFGKFRETFSF